MLSANRGIWQALVPLWFFLVCAFAPAGCTCGPEGQLLARRFIVCRPQHEQRPISPRLASKTIVPGTIPVSFGVTDSGDAALSMPIVVPPGRAGVEPSLAIYYSSNGGDGVLGRGYSIGGSSAITRCPKTIAIDGEIREIDYSSSDARCLDGKRLVIVAKNGDDIEYRTFPDSQVKVIEHSATNESSYFEAFLPSGWIVEYGKTAGSRPLARNGAPRAWLATETRDARGNSMTYGYCFAESDEGFTVEYALDELTYTGFDGEEGTRTVSFVYGAKDDVRTAYSAGMAFQNALRLDEVQTSVDGELVRRYEFAYEQGETTGRTRLVSAQECGAEEACKPETRFQYAKNTTGFELVKTTITAPLSKLSSPMLADFNGDGLDDLLLPDTSELSTSTNPITEWRLARNRGNQLALPKVAFSQEWSFVQDAQDQSDPGLLQPELGVALDYNQDGRADILLYDVYGNRNNHIVLLSKADGTFEELDTGIQRPFSLGLAPKQLRSPGGSVHLADVDADGVGDLIQCEDHGNSPEVDPSQSAWTVHLWRPGGFEATGASIEPLAGFSCAIELRTVDVNRNGKIDLVLPEMIRIGGTPATQTTTYSSLERRADSTWRAWDTKLPIPPSPGRVIWADVNGDGLPDAITSGLPDGRLRTWLNTDGHFAEKPVESLKWEGAGTQDTYFHLATPLDWDGDGRTDLLMPMSAPPELPKWFVLRATDGFTFERIDAGIPFEAELGEAVTLADPRGPRVGDVNGDGAPDILLFIGNELHVFQNRASNPDVLVSFSDGLNEHEPEDSSFVPNVSITYGHLIDESITNGAEQKESYLYLSRSDTSNTCEYPRRCAVGSRRVVQEYAVNDGQGDVRRFGLRYRDGRYDRRGHGFLGFGERIVTDLDTNAGTATFYDNKTLVKVGERDVYPFAGQVTSQWRWAPALPHESKQNRVELALTDMDSDVVPTNDAQTYFTLSTKRRMRRMQGTLSGGTPLESWVASVATNENAIMLQDTSVDVSEYDAYRNVLAVAMSTVGVDLTYELRRTVKNDTARWILGQVQEQTECSKTSLVPEQCRLLSRTTNQFGEVESESTSDEAIPDSKLTVEYDKRDKYGNIEHVTAHDELGHVRGATTVFDDEGVFPVKEINVLLHETALDYDQRFGVLRKATDPNQLVTEWKYDSFGRETTEKRPDGSQTTTTLSREKVGENWRYSQRIVTTGGADDETIFDSLGRPIRTFSHGPTPTGQKTPRRMEVFGYDRLTGKMAKRSVTTAEGTPDDQLLFDSYEFDSIGREIRHTTPWNATTTTAYDGFVIDSTDPLLQHTLTQIDELGRPVTVTDAAKGKTSYTYSAFNRLHTATDPGNATTTWTLDTLGQPRSIEDPDRGTTTLAYNGFGELVSSTDALGRVVTFDVDELGRVERRTDKLGAQVQTTAWKWDTAPHGLGRLHSVTSPDAIQSFSYTAMGQIEGMAQTVDGGSFAARQTYDNVGRVKSVDYPQPLGQEPFGVMYEHDEHGFVIGVREKNTNEPFWMLKEADDAGRFQKERFGNEVETTRTYDTDKQTLKGISTTHGPTNIQTLAYDWDQRLNLKSRTDALQPQHKTERFRYDELDRVTCAYFGAVEDALAPCETSYSYHANGNLWEKSDVGVYSYLDAKHPHAVTHVVPGETYFYDAVGNQITRPGGVSITYTPFDLPKTITKGGKTTSLGYDGHQRRIRKTTPSSETLYFGDIFEQVTSAGSVERRFYVHSPERAIAVVTRGGAKPGTVFLHVDHLGSIDVITKEDGSIDERRSYGAYGARRNPEWGKPSGAITSRTTLGYTGHEEEDDLGLVNAKGRMYDPRLARFTTTDPVIADIFDGQSLNKYSYVKGNPLAFIDPTGFFEVDSDAGQTKTHPQTQSSEEIVVASDSIVPKVQQTAASAPIPAPTPRQEAAEELFESIESTNSMRFTGDMGTTGNGASGLPQETTDPESSSWRNNPYVNGIGGFAVGLLEGIVPGAALSYGLQDAFGEHDGMMRQARIGRSLGQMLGGAITAGIGLAGEAAATGFVLTGVGSVVGVPVAAVSTVAVASGAANFLAGFQGLAKQLTGGSATRGPPPSTTSPKSYHGNDLRTTKPARGYELRDRKSGEILKYGETTKGKRRYTEKFLDRNQAEMNFVAKGTKAEMHKWQHEKILEFKAQNGGKRPPLNKSDW